MVAVCDANNKFRMENVGDSGSSDVSIFFFFFIFLFLAVTLVKPSPTIN